MGKISLIREVFLDANADGKPDHLGETVTVRGVLISDPISLQGPSLVNLQDSSGGVILFTRQEGLLVGKVHRGDLVTASGEVTLYKGNRELILKDLRYEGAGKLPLPPLVTVSELMGVHYSGALIRVIGDLKVGSDFLSNKGSVVLQDPSGQISVLVADRFFAKPEFLERFQQGGKVEVVGIAGQTKEGAVQELDYRIVPRDAADFKFSSIPPYRNIAVATGFLFLSALVWIAVSRRRLADRQVRELERESKRSAEERDRFFTLSLDMLCIASTEGYFRRLNPAFTQTLGWSMEELLSRPFIEFVHFDDRVATLRTIENLAGGATTGDFENRFQCKNASWRILSWKAVSQPDGTLYATARDITEQCKTDAELRMLNEQLEQRVAERTAEIRQALATLDATEDAALIFEPETLRLTYVNQGAERQLGYSREELLMKTSWQIGLKFDEDHFRQIIAPMVQGKTRRRQFTTAYLHKDGHEIPVEINLQYVTPAGERPRFITIARDITERMKNERVVQHSQRLESLGTLAGGIAHDLNNALSPILMGIELLKMQYPNASGIVDMCQSSAQRSAAMVRQLLTFAKGAEGKRVSVQLSHLLSEMVNIINSTFPKNIHLIANWTPNLPTIFSDATQINQILLNLCVNARDAMPDGGTLILEAQPAEMDAASTGTAAPFRGGKYVMLQVRDSGVGIPPEILERIFEPFFTTKGPDRGTGLGLSTVMGIVKAHDGFLQVQSQPGQGSTFTVYLPADTSGSAVQPLVKETVEFRGRGETVLLVDDELSVREVACAIFARLNLKLLTATDGTEGLVQAAQNQSSLRAIITDVNMPNMGGMAFVRTVRKMLPNVSIVVTTGLLESVDFDEFKMLGVQAILAKPFTEQELATVLEQVFSGGLQTTPKVVDEPETCDAR